MRCTHLQQRRLVLLRNDYASDHRKRAPLLELEACLQMKRQMKLMQFDDRGSNIEARSLTPDADPCEERDNTYHRFCVIESQLTCYLRGSFV